MYDTSDFTSPVKVASAMAAEMSDAAWNTLAANFKAAYPDAYFAVTDYRAAAEQAGPVWANAEYTWVEWVKAHAVPVVQDAVERVA